MMNIQEEVTQPSPLNGDNYVTGLCTNAAFYNEHFKVNYWLRSIECPNIPSALFKSVFHKYFLIILKVLSEPND